MPDFTAITPEALADLIAQRATTLAGPAVIAIDGADAADPVAFAGAVAERIRTYGRPSEVISMHAFVRPASLRLEYDRDELSYRTAWFDYPAVKREVLDALRERGEWLPALWDERTDRSARARMRPATPDTVLLVAGPMLLGRALDFDLTVALQMSPGALRRNTKPDDWFTLDAVGTHQQERTDQYDIVVAWDHADRPAIRNKTN